MLTDKQAVHVCAQQVNFINMQNVFLKEYSKKEIGYYVFPDVNRIGRPNAVTSIPILLGHYRQLRLLFSL